LRDVDRLRTPLISSDNISAAVGLKHVGGRTDGQIR